MKDSFVFHFDWVLDLPEEFQDLYILRAVRYAMSAEEPEVDGLEKTVWLKIKRQIDDDTERYQAKVEKRREAGKKGGRPRKEEEGPASENTSTLNGDVPSPEKTAIKTALENQGLIYEPSDIAKMVDRVPLTDTQNYIDFVCAKVRRMYEGKAPDEIRLIIRSALQSWDNLRGEYEAHLKELEEAERQKPEERETAPSTCPVCGGAIDTTFPDMPKCSKNCGFYTWEAKRWEWNPYLSKPFTAEKLPKPKEPEPAPVTTQIQNDEEYTVF